MLAGERAVARGGGEAIFEALDGTRGDGAGGVRRYSRRGRRSRGRVHARVAVGEGVSTRPRERGDGKGNGDAVVQVFVGNVSQLARHLTQQQQARGFVRHGREGRVQVLPQAQAHDRIQARVRLDANALEQHGQVQGYARQTGFELTRDAKSLHGSAFRTAEGGYDA